MKSKTNSSIDFFMAAFAVLNQENVTFTSILVTKEEGDGDHEALWPTQFSFICKINM